MKKIFFCLTFISINSFFAYAQQKSTNPADESKRGFIGICLGPSLSFTDFASKDIDNENAGFAKTGFNLNLSFGYRLGKHFGLSGMLFGNTNSFNDQGFEDIFTADVQVSSTPWKCKGAMVGAYYSSASSKVSFEMRFDIGYANSTAPEITANLTDGSGYPAQVFQESASAGTLCAIFGVGLKSALSEKISFLGNLDFFSTEPEFSNVNTYLNNSLFSTDTYNQKIETINITVGIAYNLK